MYRSRLVLLGVISFTLVSANRVSAQGKMLVGVQGGTNIASQFSSRQFYGSDISRYSRKGVIIGGIVEMQMSEPFYFAPEVRYIQKGVGYEGFPLFQNPLHGVGPLESQLEYIEVATNFEAKFGQRQFTFDLLAGPSFGINTSSRSIQPVYETSGNHYVNETDNKNVTHLLEISVDGGAGVEIELSDQLYLGIHALYSLGLTDVYDEQNADPPYTESTGIQILGRLMFSL